MSIKKWVIIASVYLHCVTDALKDGDGEEAIQELMDVFKRFTKA